MNFRIAKVEVVQYPVLRITFSDGFAGDYDLSDVIGDGPIFERLKDLDFFCTVAVGDYGRTLGWSLDRDDEIDLCADATRIHLETQAVEQLAERYRESLSAAE